MLKNNSGKTVADIQGLPEEEIKKLEQKQKKTKKK